MRRNIEELSRKLKDDRGKKVIFAAHCILNQNSRYLGGAFRKGCIDELVDHLQKSGVGMIQMKCPEQKAWGGVLKKYMWLPIGRKNSLLYKLRGVLTPIFIWRTKRVFQKIAGEVASEIKDYLDSGFEVVGVLGIDGSPSCGVNKTVDVEKFVGLLAGAEVDEFDRDQMNLMVKGCLADGSGYFIKALEQALKKKNLSLKFIAHDLIKEMDGAKAAIEILNGA